MPTGNQPTKKNLAFPVPAEIHTGIKMDCVRWDCHMFHLVQGLLSEYLSRPAAERERFVRSLGAP